MSSGAHAKRERDAEVARQAILDAAEEVFAKNGFDGARIDAIAAASGYNKSLIFHYFGDKLGLYAEVVKRADREMTALQVRVLLPLLKDETIASNAHSFKAVLEIIVITLFDYLAEHERFMRMLLWEQAEGWQTYAKIISLFDVEDAQQLLDPLIAGLLHHGDGAVSGSEVNHGLVARLRGVPEESRHHRL